MTRIEEFWYCVAPQEDLPLYKGTEIDARPCENLFKLISTYKKGISNSEIETFYKTENIITSTEEALIRKLILENPSSINELRILVGVSDKRLYLDLSYLVHIYEFDGSQRLVPEPRQHLLKHDTNFFIHMLESSPHKKKLASLVANYFINRGLIEILETFSALAEKQISQIFNNLITPKEIQQMQAKYRGHGAEQAFAKIVQACGLSMIPEGKDIDPMAGYDPNVDLSSMVVVQRNASDSDCHSFDLVVNSNDKIRVLIQSLIHSSDPGQYGVNKSDETIQIHNLIDHYNSSISVDDKVYLLGSVDGVGFSENPNGTIVKMIDVFDDFFQMNTLFKIPVFFQKIGLINNVHGVCFDSSYFDTDTIRYFKTKYLDVANVLVLNEEDIKSGTTIKAGKAWVVFNK